MPHYLMDKQGVAMDMWTSSQNAQLAEQPFEIEERKPANQVKKPGQRLAVAMKTGPA